MDLNGKRIMITTGGGVGDLIMYTPVLRKLKQNYDCYLMLLTQRNAGILQGLPYIDEIVYMQRGVLFSKFRHLNKLKNVDALIMTDWQPNILLAAKFYGVPVVAGYPREGKLVSRIFTKSITTKWYKSRDYVARTHAKVISEALNLDIYLDEVDLQCDVGQPDKADAQAANALLKDIGIEVTQPYFVLAPYAGFKLRDWPQKDIKQFIHLVEAQYGLPVVLIGGPENRKESIDITPYNLVGKTNLLQLVELVRRARFMFATDSGPMHMAGALKTPLIPFFGKDLPSRWAPKNNCWPITLNYPCSPCNDETALHCDKHVGCLNNITAEMVYEKLIELVESGKVTI